MPYLGYIILYTFVLSLIFVLGPSYESVAKSPSFPLQGIRDSADDFVLNQPNATNENPVLLGTHDRENFPIPYEGNLADCMAKRGSSTPPYNIQHVTYVSDGNRINGTMYLTRPIYNPGEDNLLESLEWIDVLPVNLSKYENLSSLEAFVDKANASLPYANITSSSNMIIGNKYQAHKLDYEIPEQISPKGKKYVHYSSIFTIVGDRGYVITFRGSSDDFSLHIEDVIKSVVFADDTFKFEELDESGITIQIPSNWEEWKKGNELPNYVSVLGIANNNSKYYRLPPIDVEGEEHRPYFILQAENLPSKDMSLEAYAKEDNIITNKNVSEMMKFNLTQITIEKDIPAYKTEYAYLSEGTEFQALKVLLVQNDKVYQLQFVAQHEKYPYYIKIIEKIVDTIQMNPSNNLKPYIPSVLDYDFLIRIPKDWELKSLYNQSEVNPVIRAFPNNSDLGLTHRSSLNSSLTYSSSHWELPQFTMAVFSESSYGTDQVVMNKTEWNNTSTVWDNIIIQGPGISNQKTDRLYNKTNFFESGSNYITFGTDLNSLNYPDHYKILFYLNHRYLSEDGTLCTISDISDWAFAPPPEFNITASLSSLEMIPGDEKSIRLTVKSNTQEDYSAHFRLNDRINGIFTNFVPKDLDVPITGEGSTKLKVNASENVSIGSYTLPVDIRMSFNSTAYSPALNQTIKNPPITEISKTIPLTINIVPVEYNITASPSSLELRPSDKKDVEVKLASSTNLNSKISFNVINTSDVRASFSPNVTNAPPLGTVTSTLHVEVNSDAKPMPNTLLLSVNFMTDTGVGNNDDNTSHHSLPKQFTLPVTVLPALTTEEHLANASKWFSSLNSIWAFIAAVGAVAASFVTRIYTRKQEEKKKGKDRRIDDYSS